MADDQANNGAEQALGNAQQDDEQVAAQIQGVEGGRQEDRPPRNIEDIIREQRNLPGVLDQLDDFVLRLERRRGFVRIERPKVTDEMIKEAQNLREKDETDPSSTVFSRHCVVCVAENPRQRAVYSLCGHFVCYPCAVDNAKNAVNGGTCVFCRKETGFVKLFEDGRNTVYVENGSQTDVISKKRSVFAPPAIFYGQTPSTGLPPLPVPASRRSKPSRYSIMFYVGVFLLATVMVLGVALIIYIMY